MPRTANMLAQSSSQRTGKMKLQNKIKMISEMASELRRLVLLWGSFESVRAHWGMASDRGISGNGSRLIAMSNGKYLGRDMGSTTFIGDAYDVPRDHFDILWDFFAGYLTDLYLNVWKYARCSHAHQSISVDWAINSEVGWIKSTQCCDCGTTYLGGREDFDRYAGA